MSTPLRRALCTALAAALVAFPALAGELEIHLIKVGDSGTGEGQGLSVYVEGPDGTRVLIDGGNSGDGNAIVQPYLASQGVTGLDYGFMTHWHTDHMGGLDEVFNAGLKPPIAYDRGDFQRPSNSQVTQYLSAASGVRATPTVGQVVAIGDGATIQVLAINGQTIGGNKTLTGSENQYENAASMALLVSYRDFECYVGGDVTGGGSSTPNVEGLFVSTVGQVDVAISSHHGSNTSSQSTVVSALAPSLVLHSCGTDNPYGHPDDLVTKRWSTPAAARVQWSTTEGDTVGSGVQPEAGGFTGVNGTVVVRTDGVHFSASRPDGTDSIEFTTWENPGLPPSPGAVVINEVLVDPAASSDSYGEWFEIQNLTADPRDLGGTNFSSAFSSFTLASRVLLHRNRPLVIGRDGKPYRNGGMFTPVPAPENTIALSNSPSSLVLTGPGGTLETVAWGGGGFPVTSGVAYERVDGFGGTGASNFVAAGATFGVGDLGTPGAANGADTTSWPAGLWNPPTYVNGVAEWHLSSYDEPVSLYLLATSTGISFPGIPFLGVFIPLNPDPLFFALLEDPQFFSNLDSNGERVVSMQIPNDPSLAGLTLYSTFLTLDFFPSLKGKLLSNLSSFTIAP